MPSTPNSPSALLTRCYVIDELVKRGMFVRGAVGVRIGPVRFYAGALDSGCPYRDLFSRDQRRTASLLFFSSQFKKFGLYLCEQTGRNEAVAEGSWFARNR
jgi:hypothetical protein